MIWAIVGDMRLTNELPQNWRSVTSSQSKCRSWNSLKLARKRANTFFCILLKFCCLQPVLGLSSAGPIESRKLAAFLELQIKEAFLPPQTSSSPPYFPQQYYDTKNITDARKNIWRCFKSQASQCIFFLPFSSAGYGWHHWCSKKTQHSHDSNYNAKLIFSRSSLFRNTTRLREA